MKVSHSIRSTPDP